MNAPQESVSNDKYKSVKGVNSNSKIMLMRGKKINFSSITEDSTSVQQKN